MIGYEQALAVCRTDPEAAARMLFELARELEQLKAEVATLKAERQQAGNLGVCYCLRIGDGQFSLRQISNAPYARRRTVCDFRGKSE